MSRRNRQIEKLRQEEGTVGMRRDERKEQEELAGKKKIEAAKSKALRILEMEQKKKDIDARPPRIARVGKPLRR
jgi:hypothetical protein